MFYKGPKDISVCENPTTIDYRVLGYKGVYDRIAQKNLNDLYGTLKENKIFGESFG